jgi:hypothetical protein
LRRIAETRASGNVTAYAIVNLAAPHDRVTMMTLYEYYARQPLLPTEGDFDLAAHEAERRLTLTERLALPTRMFRDARLLEFGPDAGANAVVFALWGARCTLAEPNLQAHPLLSRSFEAAGLAGSVEALHGFDVDAFPVSLGPFDVIDAEGFAYTLPLERWLGKFSQLVSDEGYVIVSYYAAPGSFFELLWKVVHARFRALTGLDGAAAAERLFGTKWASIPHRRSLASWTMDVLENPFVRLRYFIDPGALLEQAALFGFVLHSSWPQYRDPFDVGWHKRRRDPREDLERHKRFVRTNSLSYLLGRSHPSATDHRDAIDAMLAALDSLIDGFVERAAIDCRRALAAIAENIVSGSEDDIERSRQSIASALRLLDLLMAGDAAALEEFCASDVGFVESWGAPCHYAVLRRTSAARDLATP